MAEKGILKVFISSTFRDLKEVRRLLIGGINEALEAVAMEKFIPSDESPHRKSIEYLEESDVCIFIIEDHYGTLIGDCKMKTSKCGDCSGDISYTHCEYRRALQNGKPYIVYLIKNEVADILSGIQKIDLESTEENEVLGFLRRSNIDSSKVSLFLGYTVEQLRELGKVARDENKGRIEQFRKEIKGLYRSVEISKKEDYYAFYEILIKDLKEKIIEWYKDERIRFAGFAGRGKELEELLEKIKEMNSVCVVGTGGVGKTSLIQLGLLLEKLSGRRVYALLKEYSYKYTRAGYPFAKGRFTEATFSERLTLTEILKLIFQKDVRREDILETRENDQISMLIEDLDREGSILFLDDLQNADKKVKRFVYTCGNNLSNGAVVAGVRRSVGCYSTVGPLSGLRGIDLKEMINILAKTHSTENSIKDDLDVWSQEVFRVTQGHPMLVDIIVRNASKFPSCEKLKGITGVISVEEQDAVNEVMNRLIHDILTEEELRILEILSIFPLSADKRILRKIGGKKVVYGIIEKGFLDWNDSKLVFTFDAIRELLEAKAPTEYHDIAVEYYSEELERANKFEKPSIYVERIYHLLKGGKYEEAFELYFDNSENLERASRNRAIEISNMILEKITNEKVRADILIIIGNLQSTGKEFSRAEESYSEALGIYRRLAEEDCVAGTLNNLGDLYTSMKEFKIAEEPYLEALEIYEKLADKDPAVYEPYLAMTLSNVGNLYNGLKEFKNAEESYGKALKIRRKLAEKDPAVYEIYAGITLNNIGNLYIDMGEYMKAEKSCREALEIFRRLTDKDPDTYNPHLAMTLGNLGNLYNYLKNSEKAGEYYVEALEIYRGLAEDDPNAFEPDLGRTLNNLGALYTDTKEYEKAEECSMEALRIRRKLAEKDPAVYEPSVAETLNNLGGLYSDLKESKKAEESYNRALEIYRKLVKKDPSVYVPRVAMILNNLGALYTDTKEYEKAEKCSIEALKIRRKLAERDPAVYKSSVAETLNNLGGLYWKIKEFKKAEESYNEALGIYRKLAKKDPDAYEFYVGTLLGSLGGLFGDLEEFEKAEEFFIEALKYKDRFPDGGARALLGLAIVMEEMEKESAYGIYFVAGMVSFNLLIASGQSSIDSAYCFRKTKELSPADSPLNRMATIAISGFSKIVGILQPTNELHSLKIDDLPEICRAVVDLIIKRRKTHVKKPENSVELMFYYIYERIENEFH